MSVPIATSRSSVLNLLLLLVVLVPVVLLGRYRVRLGYLQRHGDLLDHLDRDGVWDLDELVDHHWVGFGYRDLDRDVVGDLYGVRLGDLEGYGVGDLYAVGGDFAMDCGAEFVEGEFWVIEVGEGIEVGHAFEVVRSFLVDVARPGLGKAANGCKCCYLSKHVQTKETRK